jgi:hypothetical protein
LDYKNVYNIHFLLDKRLARKKYTKPKNRAIKNKPRMRCGRNRTAKSISKKTLSEKSDADPPDYIIYRKAKFVPVSRDKFGFFLFGIKLAVLFTVGCRSPPITFVF